MSSCCYCCSSSSRTCSWSPLVAVLLLIMLQAHPCLSNLLTPAQQLKFASKSKNLRTSGSEVEDAAGNPAASDPVGRGRRRQLLFIGFGQKAPKADRPLTDGVKVELMHRDHVSSPLRAANRNLTSLADRIRQDVERSGLRSRDFHMRTTDPTRGQLGGGSSTVNVDNFESPLSATLAEYVMSLSVGSPPQKFVAVVDTGSDLVWVQCNPCSRCFPQPGAIFNPAQSSSYRPLSCTDGMCGNLDLNLQSCSPNCQYNYAYGDSSSTSGDFSTETITLGTTSGGSREVANFAFGCGHSNQGTFSATDGLVGLGQGSISFSTQLGSLYGDKFSYCLVSREEALTQTSPLLFGDAAVPMASTGLQYTPMLPNKPGISTFYYVGLEGLSVGGAMLNIPVSVFQKDSSGNGGMVLDSGTTFTQLVPTAFDAVIRAFQLALPYKQVSGSPNVGLDLCFDIAGVQNVVVPELSFHFTNANFDLPAENYFVLVDNAETMCLAISRSKSPLNIFGNTQQQNFQILYDRSNARIGFTPLLCNSLR